MPKNEILIQQAKLFNNTLNDEQINYIVNNNILIYSDFTNIKYEDSKIILLEDIDWIYDENNYRIPYLNETKLFQIKLNNINCIYDYI